MKNVVIIEDEDDAFRLLEGFLRRFGEENHEEFHLFRFSDAFSFLDGYSGNYDLILMDIMLPSINGMELAKRVREQDKTVPIIFVTNMAQFAVKGYEVGASDFIVKPVSYYDFSTKIKRTFENSSGDPQSKILLSYKKSMLVIDVSDIKWLEVILRRLIYHTTGGDVEVYGTLTKAIEALERRHFIRANRSVLVNPRFITSVEDDVVKVGGDTIYLSRNYKKSFSQQLSEYYGE